MFCRAGVDDNGDISDQLRHSSQACGEAWGVGQVRAGKAQATLVLPRSWLAHRWHGQAQLTLFLQLLQAAPNLPVWPLFGHNPPSPPRWGSTGPWPNVLRGFSKLASLSCTRPEHLALVAMVNPGSKSPTHSNQTRHLPPSTASPSKPPAQRMIHTIHLVSRAQNPGVTLGSSLPPLSPHRQAQTSQQVLSFLSPS